MEDTKRAPASPARGQRLLLVDDDPDITAMLERYLAAQGFLVTVVRDGVAMKAALAGDHPIDLVLLDLGLPGEDGLDLTRFLHNEWHGPVIIVTGRGEAVDRVVGLELGADDYVTKPFDLRELLARIRTVLRRTVERSTVPAEQGLLRFSGFQLDLRSHSLTDAHGGTIALTSGEFALLRILAAEPNRVLTRDALMTGLHGRDTGPFDRAIDVQISRLRRKIEADPARPEIIKSVRGEGYLFAAQVTRA